MRPLISTAVVNGVRLAYEEHGDGEPVVLVHGGVSDMRSWEAQVVALAREYRVINYSRRYHVPNEEIPEGVADPMSAHVDDLAGLLEAFDAGPAHLVGHSWGAITCLTLGVRSPALVRTMVLEEPPLMSLVVGLPPSPGQMLRLLVNDPAMALPLIRFGRGIKPSTKALARGDHETGLRLFLRAVGADLDGLSEDRREQRRANVKPLEAEFVRGGLEPLGKADASRATAPTLILNGDRSAVFFQRVADRLARVMPNAERAEVAGASHWVHEDAPSAVNDLILAFLRRRGQ